MTTYLLAGGGTAGHVSPLLAIADRLRQRDPQSTVLVLGTQSGLEARLVPERGYELLTIDKVPFPRRPGRAALRFPSALRRAVAATRAIIRERGVDFVVGVGGYAAAPAYLAARAEKLPFAIHEANARPGMANRLGARFTRFVGVTFANTALPHAVRVGTPLRVEIENLDRPAARREALTFFGLEPDKPVLLVTGGSTGARSVNATIAQSVPLLLGTGWQVLHITGELSDLADPELGGYVMIRYCDRMELALAVADLAVSRAGSATLSELAAVGVPAVLIPYPVGNGEQLVNAEELVAAGGAVVVLDADFTTEWVASQLVPLMQDRATVAEMAAAAASVGILDGTDRMVALIDQARSAGDARASA